MFGTYPIDQTSAITHTNLSTESNQRAGTLAGYHDAVEQVIPAMHERFGESLSLQEMADVAALSPHHFNRVFRKITGITPSRFLCALRLQAATQLLLTTQLSVTEVCFEVGYNSLGTFTSRFTELIGLPPSQLRDLSEEIPAKPDLLMVYGNEGTPGPTTSTDTPISDSPSRDTEDICIAGRIHAPECTLDTIFVGLYPAAIPQGIPVGCALLTQPGEFHIRSVPDGRYYAFAAGFPQTDNPMSYLLPKPTNLKVGRHPKPIEVSQGKAQGHLDLILRNKRVTDPPILSALPFLLVRRAMEHMKLNPRRALPLN